MTGDAPQNPARVHPDDADRLDGSASSDDSRRIDDSTGTAPSSPPHADVSEASTNQSTGDGRPNSSGDESATRPDSVVDAVAGDVRAIGEWFESTSVARAYRRWTAAAETAVRHSALARMLARITTWIRHSFAYRWLTKEPDPDVIVIDLRKTYTVGPFIAVLDRLAPLAERVWRGSFVHRIAERVKTAAVWTWAAESRTVQLLAAALEPPEPPEERRWK